MLFGMTEIGFGQTQKPSVRTGVTFQWADTQSATTDPATLEAITIDGVVYESIVTPSSYAMTRVEMERRTIVNLNLKPILSSEFLR